jgi:hypothetical protein
MRRAMTTAVILATALAAGAALAQGGAKKAQQPQIGVTVSQDPLVQGEPFELTITIETESSDEPQVQLPALGGLRVLRQYESHPMSFSFSFGFGQQKAVKQTKQRSEYSFVVVADRAGKFTVNPVIVTVDGKRFQSQAYGFEVQPSSGGAAAPGKAVPLQPDPNAPQADQIDEPGVAPPSGAELEGAQIDPDYFLHTVVSKKRCSMGELVVLRLYVYTSWSLSGVQLVREPGTDGFWVENVDTGAKHQLPQEQVRIGDRVYERVELRRIALFPLRGGELTIAPALAELEVRRGGFFSSPKKVRRASQPVVVTVDPLPDAGRPAGFDPANVGRFSFRAELDKETAKVGEPLTLSMIARGAGNVRNLVVPEIAEIDGLKIYAPESDVEVAARDESVTGTLTNKVLIIPKAPGSYTIPELAWSYFDPLSREYETLTSPAKRFTVTPAEGGAPTGQPPAGAAPAAQDDGGAFGRMTQKLRSIATRADVEPDGGGIVLNEPWFLALVALAPIAFVALVAAQITRRRGRDRLLRDRSKRADAVARRRLDELAARGDGLDGDRFFAELQRALVAFLEDRLECPVAGDTSAELAARLRRRGFGDELAEATVAEMESCDFARFARSASAAGERRGALERIRSLVARLAAVAIEPEEGKP